MTELSVVIVNYNVKELLENCIRSIFSAQNNLELEIIIVDNNSFDNSVSYLKNKFPEEKRIKFIENRTNVGFSKANNQGVSLAKGKYILILNPDTILQEDTLVKCIEKYESDPKTGVLTSKLVLGNGKLDPACRRSFPTPSVSLYRMTGLSKLFPKSKIFGKYNLTYLDENETYEVDSVTGAFMLIRKDIYEQVSGFDEDYFMYGEDLDLCFKVKKAGYKVIYYPETSTIHFKGESTRKSSLSYVNNFYGAMKIFVEKNLKTRSTLLNLLIKVSIFYRSLLSYIKRVWINIYPVFIDLLFIITAMLVSIMLRFERIPLEAYTIVLIIYSVIWLISLSIAGTYKKIQRFSIISPLNGILLGFFINSSFTYFFNEFAYSRAVVLRATVYAYLLLIGWRIIFRVILYIKHKNIFYTHNNTIIIGKNDESISYVTRLKRNLEKGYNFLGYISINGTGNTTEYIGNLNNLNDVVQALKINNIIFVKSLLSVQQMLDIMWNLRKFNLDFKIITSDKEFLLGKSEIDKVDDIYLMEIEYNINKKLNIFVKRLFDIVLGIISIILIYPIVLLINKFKPEMVENDKFLSKILLIPGVLSGKYSFVGRAIWDKTSLGKNFLGKPGLTGLVQLNYYKELTYDEIEYYNSYYAKNQSLSLDLEILLKTVSLYLFRKRVIKL